MREYTVKEISELVNGKVYGNPEIKIRNIAEIDKAVEGDITFLSNPKYNKHLKTTKASCIIVSEKIEIDDNNFIVAKDPYYAFTLFLKHCFSGKEPAFKGISTDAKISDNVTLGNNVNIAPFCFVGLNTAVGSNCTIYPNVFIDKHVKIGKNCIIYSNVSIRDESIIGNNVIIHAGTVIGSDGFGFAFRENKYEKIPQVGRVIIEDDVEIGANCCIDRAAIGETIIKKGTKLDNLIQVAHNVVIGENTAIASQTGISGSTKIGNYVQIGGQVGFAGHINVGDKVKIGGQAGVTKDVPPGIYITGTPARPFMQIRRLEAVLTKLPEIYKKLKKII